MKHKKAICCLLALTFLFNLIIPINVFASESINNNFITDDEISTSQLKNLDDEINNVLEIIDNALITENYEVDWEQVLPKKDGESEINGVPSKAVKEAAKWLKSNWSKVYAKLPDVVKPYLTFDAVTKVIDAYVGFSDTIDEFLTNVVNACLPSFLEWMTPGIVTIISLLLPF